MTSPKGKCEICGYPLVPIGRSRRKGRDHKDWVTRKEHKQCWLNPKEELWIIQFYMPAIDVWHEVEHLTGYYKDALRRIAFLYKKYPDRIFNINMQHVSPMSYDLENYYE